jgi:hypothetical protein
LWDSMVFCIIYPKIMSRISVGNLSRNRKVGGVFSLIVVVYEAEEKSVTR